jgi:hypothetical protein
MEEAENAYRLILERLPDVTLSPDESLEINEKIALLKVRLDRCRA